ncbi:MAG: HD domain-containing protein [Phycisphaerae bacterium]|nr:HD domain-containing protein [Phycisphaerae bacterium]
MRCPGQDQRYWKPDDIFEVNCSQCGYPIEFFKDEARLKCRQCKHTVINPRIDLGCAEWCQYAAQCLGTTLKNLTTLRSELIEDMKGVFGQDQPRVDHALAVLDYAEQIQAVEGGDPLVVKAAGILHDIGIHQAEEKHGSAAGSFQEVEGPPVAEEILTRREVPDEATEHVCKIIANHHSARDIDTLEFRILWDADWLVNLQEAHQDMSHDQWTAKIDKIFKTPTGRQLALQQFVV